jgi:hypothetical protein
MRDLPSEWTDSFEYVSWTFSELGCFAEESDDQRVPDEVARVLMTDGCFLLDIVVNRDGLVNRGETRAFLEGDRFFVSESGGFDLLSGIRKRVFRWYNQAQHHETEWQIRAYTPPDVERMLTKAGLRVLAVHGNLNGDELGRDSMGMLFAAQM